MAIARMGILLKKEVKTQVFSSSFALIFGVYAFVLGWIFFNLLVSYLGSVHNHMPHQSSVSFEVGVIYPFFNNMNFLMLLVTPALTMKAFAFERQKKTLALLMTTPLRPWELVLGKWLASLVLFSLLLAVSLIMMMTLVFSGTPVGEGLTWGYMAIFLNSLVYTSLGVFISSLTENQNVAALLTILGVAILWLIPWASQNTLNLLLIEVFRYLGILTHFTQIISEGTLYSYQLFYYLSLAWLFLMLTTFMVKKMRS